MQKLDLRATKATGFIKEEGIYTGVITNVTEGPSKTSGALQHTITCTDNATGLSMVNYMTWGDEKAMARNKGELMSLGLDLDNVEFDPNALVGLPIRFEAKYSTTKQRDAFGKEKMVKGDFLGCTILGLADETPQVILPTSGAVETVQPQTITNTQVAQPVMEQVQPIMGQAQVEAVQPMAQAQAPVQAEGQAIPGLNIQATPSIQQPMAQAQAPVQAEPVSVQPVAQQQYAQPVMQEAQPQVQQPMQQQGVVQPVQGTPIIPGINA